MSIDKENDMRISSVTNFGMYGKTNCKNAVSNNLQGKTNNNQSVFKNKLNADTVSFGRGHLQFDELYKSGKYSHRVVEKIFDIFGEKELAEIFRDSDDKVIKFIVCNRSDVEPKFRYAANKKTYENFSKYVQEVRKEYRDVCEKTDSVSVKRKEQLDKQADRASDFMIKTPFPCAEEDDNPYPTAIVAAAFDRS